MNLQHAVLKLMHVTVLGGSYSQSKCLLITASQTEEASAVMHILLAGACNCLTLDVLFCA